jgi:hypothetical protein
MCHRRSGIHKPQDLLFFFSQCIKSMVHNVFILFIKVLLLSVVKTEVDIFIFVIDSCVGNIGLLQV